MGKCIIQEPPVWTEEIPKWDKQTDADGDAMGGVIELLANNAAYNKKEAEELEKNKVNYFNGDIANTKVASLQASTAQYPVPAAGDTTKAAFGKIKKFCEDIRNWMTGVCLIGQIVNNCVTNRADLPLSAAQGKVLMDLYNVLNAKLSETKVESIYVTIKKGNNFVWTEHSLIDPTKYHYENPENIPIVASIGAVGIPKYKGNLLLTSAVFSQYGTVGFQFNKAVDEDVSVCVSVLYLKKA